MCAYQKKNKYVSIYAFTRQHRRIDINSSMNNTLDPFLYIKPRSYKRVLTLTRENRKLNRA